MGSSIRKVLAFFTESCESFIPLSSGAKGAGGGRGGSIEGGGGAAGSEGAGTTSGVGGITVTEGVIGTVGADPTIGSAGTSDVFFSSPGFCGRATVGTGVETGWVGGTPVDCGNALGCSLTAPVTFSCGNVTLGAGASGLC